MEKLPHPNSASHFPLCPPTGYLTVYSIKQPESIIDRSPPIDRPVFHSQSIPPAAAAANIQSRRYRKAYSHHDSGYNSTSRDQIRKKEDRREKNRLAAKSCREEKQNYIRSLESRISMLEARNRELIGKLSGLKDIIVELSKDKMVDVDCKNRPSSSEIESEMRNKFETEFEIEHCQSTQAKRAASSSAPIAFRDHESNSDGV